MEFFRIKKDIPFMRHALVLNAISLITFLAAVFFLWHNGLHLSIEFTGGTVMEVSYPQTAPLDSIRTKVEKLGYADTQIQNFAMPTAVSDVTQMIPSARLVLTAITTVYLLVQTTFTIGTGKAYGRISCRRVK